MSAILRCFLVLSLSHLGQACMPVNPGEELPCPSVPSTTTATGYTVSGLSGPTTSNGATVYSCTAPNKLLKVNGNTVTELTSTATLQCKTNSGMFLVVDGSTETAVGSEKYTCGQGELPCPSVPSTTTATGYIVSGLSGPTTSNGATVYSCTTPNKLLKVDGSTVTELTSSATLQCKSNSGMFVVVDGGSETTVASEKYTCGEAEVPCPAFPAFTGTMLTGVDTATPVSQLTSPGDKVYACSSPALLYSVANDDGTMATKLSATAKLVCKVQSGKYVLVDGSSETDVVSTTTYSCGTVLCATCDQSKLLAADSTACSTQTTMFCNEKPTMMNDVNGCLTISCTGTNLLYVLTDATTAMSVTASDVNCDGTGAWNYATTTPLGSALGFVCGKNADCMDCDNAVSALYSAAVTAFTMINKNPNKPECFYSCPTGTYLDSAGQHTAAYCDMRDTTTHFDSLTGPALTGFDCLTCACDPTTGRTGQSGLCAPGKLCIAPNLFSECSGTCPANSVPSYRKMDLTLTTGTSTLIECTGTTYVAIDADASVGLTCQFADGAGYTPAAPTSACAALNSYACLGNYNCDYSKVVYVKASAGDGYIVTCETGQLVSDADGGDPSGSAGVYTCDEISGWESSITQVNCAQDNLVADCESALSTSVVYTSTCAFGNCIMKCPTGMQWSYMDDAGAPATSSYMLCQFGVVTQPDTSFPTTTPACV